MMLITGESSEKFLEDLLNVLGPSRQDRAIASAIKFCIRRGRWRARLGTTVRRIKQRYRGLTSGRDGTRSGARASVREG